jgi:hypothetical protein
MRMVTIDAETKTYPILASVGVFHQAFREFEKLIHTRSPTYFRIRKTLLTADRGVGHAGENSISDMASRDFPPSKSTPQAARMSSRTYAGHDVDNRRQNRNGSQTRNLRGFSSGNPGTIIGTIGIGGMNVGWNCAILKPDRMGDFRVSEKQRNFPTRHTARVTLLRRMAGAEAVEARRLGA